MVRKDITSSFGTASGVAVGVPLTIRLKVLDVNGDHGAVPTARRSTCGTATGTATTRCTHRAAANENYLRGVQEAGADGSLEFASIFPAAYSGRWPHIHFEVYPTLADATSASNRLRTSQLALPEAVCLEVYENAEGYAQSVTNVAASPRHRHGVLRTGTRCSWPR